MDEAESTYVCHSHGVAHDQDARREATHRQRRPVHERPRGEPVRAEGQRLEPLPRQSFSPDSVGLYLVFSSGRESAAV